MVKMNEVIEIQLLAMYRHIVAKPRTRQHLQTKEPQVIF